MSLEKRQNQVQPGPCPINLVTNQPICPPPTEIDIIKVKKIFNECMHTQVEEIEIPFDAPSMEVITTGAQEAECVSVEVLETNCSVLNQADGVKVTFTLEVSSRVPLDEGGFAVSSSTKTVTKQFLVARASEYGLDIQCHLFPQCLFCFISERDEVGNVTQVTCCIGVLILIKVEAEVQLLIPTYGYPDLPPKCDQVIGECPPDFSPDWPPYPPQER